LPVPRIETSEYDVVLAADFGHGLITPRAVELMSKKSRFLSVMTQINAANIGFHTISKYPKADYICIQEGEIRLDHRNRRDDLKPLIKGLAERLSASTIMVTRGTAGTLLYRKADGFSECPAFAIKVVDRIGAGDARPLGDDARRRRQASAEVIRLPRQPRRRAGRADRRQQRLDLARGPAQERGGPAQVMAYVDFILKMSSAVKRDYVARVTAHDKAQCAEIAIQYGKDYWDGERQYGYGGHRYDGRGGR